MVSNDSTLLTVETYESHENPINIKRRMRSSILCQFKGVSKYPFGIEACWIRFYLSNNHVTKINATLNWSKSPTTIGQYTVEKWILGELKKYEKIDNDIVQISPTPNPYP